jgi:hypothetical protein
LRVFAEIRSLEGVFATGLAFETLLFTGSRDHYASLRHTLTREPCPYCGLIVAKFHQTFAAILDVQKRKYRGLSKK